MEKQHIYLTFLSVILQYMLVANESETITKFHKETSDSFYKAVFKFKLQNGTCYSQETKIVAAVKHFVGILRLFGRKSSVEIVIYSCQCLCLIHFEFNGIEQQVAIPTFRACLLCIEKHCCIIITNSLKKTQYMPPRQKCDSLSHFYI